MNINEAFPAKYMKADVDLFDADLTVTMDGIVMEAVGQGSDQETKPVLYFTDHDKGLVLNKTNANTIAGIHGPETDNWHGKQITLFAQEVDFQGRQVLAIRVRIRKQQTSTRPTATPNKPSPSQAAFDAFVQKAQACGYTGLETQNGQVRTCKELLGVEANHKLTAADIEKATGLLQQQNDPFADE